MKSEVLQSSKQELRNKRIYFWENNDNKKASLLFMIWYLFCLYLYEQ